MQGSETQVRLLSQNPVKDYAWGSKDPSCLVGSLSEGSQQYNNYA